MVFEDDGDPKYNILNIMPDYGGAYLWGAYNDSTYVGPNIADSWSGYDNRLPISEYLQEQFHHWQLQFDITAFEFDQEGLAQIQASKWSGQDIIWDWQKYHSEGIRLARLLKQEAPDYRVIYVTPAEDCSGIMADRTEVLLNGELLVLD
ncbi:hypothetical protein [Lonepinella koalarum]